ncbi:hypothetical protein EVAR_102157_1 [Eumeta japonica]|uniref:Uncharacterized protein n=1 Tax=Eumeta variegata TaxID=151549 RepID=A0A4C1U083_EUMVA|nr:hypothetical protein EVAR_102157_1 [Eumeta japonica]
MSHAPSVPPSEVGPRSVQLTQASARQHNHYNHFFRRMFQWTSAPHAPHVRAFGRALCIFTSSSSQERKKEFQLPLAVLFFNKSSKWTRVSLKNTLKGSFASGYHRSEGISHRLVHVQTEALAEPPHGLHAGRTADDCCRPRDDRPPTYLWLDTLRDKE